MTARLRGPAEGVRNQLSELFPGCELLIEDEGDGLLSEFTYSGLTVGNTYYIQAGTYSDGDRGEIGLRRALGARAAPSDPIMEHV